jgi:hypothetical protein
MAQEHKERETLQGEVMATKLEKPLEREIRVYGVEEPVLVELSPEGLSARLKGTQTALLASWTQVIRAMNTPGNVPSYLMNKPFDFLQQTAAKRVAKKVKKVLDKDKAL